MTTGPRTARQRVLAAQGFASQSVGTEGLLRDLDSLYTLAGVAKKLGFDEYASDWAYRADVRRTNANRRERYEWGL